MEAYVLAIRTPELLYGHTRMNMHTLSEQLGDNRFNQGIRWGVNQCFTDKITLANSSQTASLNTSPKEFNVVSCVHSKVHVTSKTYKVKRSPSISTVKLNFPFGQRNYFFRRSVYRRRTPSSLEVLSRNQVSAILCAYVCSTAVERCCLLVIASYKYKASNTRLTFPTVVYDVFWVMYPLDATPCLPYLNSFRRRKRACVVHVSLL